MAKPSYDEVQKNFEVLRKYLESGSPRKFREVFGASPEELQRRLEQGAVEAGVSVGEYMAKLSEMFLQVMPTPKPAAAVGLTLKWLLFKFGVDFHACALDGNPALDPTTTMKSVFRRLQYRGDPYQLAIAQTANGQLQLLGGVLWAQEGFPLVRIDEALAKELIDRAVSSSAPTRPWDAFVIELPVGMFSTSVGQEREGLIDLFVLRFADLSGVEQWAYIAAGTSVSLHRVGCPFETFVDSDDTRSESELPQAYRLPLKDEDHDTHYALRRLIVGLCDLWPTLCVTPTGSAHRVPIETLRLLSEPTYRTYEVTTKDAARLDG